MSTEYDPETASQKLPVTPLVSSSAAYCHDKVVMDVLARKAMGIKKYGVALQPHNGRSFVLDAYEEVLDTAVYLRGLLLEEDASTHYLVLHRGDGDSETYPYDAYADVIERAHTLMEAGHEDLRVEKLTRTRIL